MWVIPFSFTNPPTAVAKSGPESLLLTLETDLPDEER
jgi:hypothetical protein